MKVKSIFLATACLAFISTSTSCYFSGTPETVGQMAYTETTYTEEGYAPPRGGHHGGRGGTCRAMGPVDFSKYYDVMRAKSFDSDKVDQAKLSARTGACFEVDQIVKLLKLLSHDSNKADMAIALYPITSDPQNWYQIESAFTFNSSWKEVVNSTIGP